MDIFLQLLLQLVLIGLNAFFAATEIAVISLNEKKIKSLAEDGDKKAGKMLHIIENPTRFLSTIQVGITLAGFLGSAFAADNFASRLTPAIMRLFGLTGGEAVINSISVILITLVLSYFTLVLGELVPKRVAMKHKEKLAGKVCGLISALAVALKPIIWLLSVSTNVILRLFRIDPNETEEKVSEEDIVIMLDAGVDEGTFKDDDIEYIKNVFKLDRLTAADIMTQRPSIVAVPETATDEEIFEVIQKEGYSRIPVYGESLDTVIGILHTREFLIEKAKPDGAAARELLAPTFIPESMHLDVLFKEMQENHTHIVVVVNEFGVVSGIVTMEDILEELVGEIWDEQDEATSAIARVDDENFTVEASVSIDEFFEFFELDADESIESTTVNGWLTEKLEKLPKNGDSFDYGRLTVTVTDADEMMAQTIAVHLNPPAVEEEEEADEEK